MAAPNNFGSRLNRWLDYLVAIVSGQAPAKGLEGRSAWRLTMTIGLIALVTSGWLVWQTIYNATRPPRLVQNTNQTTPVAELEKLQTKDTDGDGLSDYLELFSLQTSPYLSDSDSDGLSDSEESQANGDPNCPSDKTCGQIPSATGSTSGSLSPAFLRQALRAAGVPQTTLEGLSDDDILRMYQEVTAVSGVNANLDANTNPAATAPTLATLEQLTPAEIRQLLIESGIEAASLESIDDATLKEIFQEAINSETQP